MKRSIKRKTRGGMTLVALWAALAAANAPAATPVLKGQTDRPLRYRPVDSGFVIDNGTESFNRPLYGGNTAFRADAGDKPEVSMYLPGRGGVLRVGLSAGGKTVWLRDAAKIETRYADGVMRYAIEDPAWPGGTVRMTVTALRETDGYAVSATATGLPESAEFVFAYGGANDERSRRNGDIGTEPVPVSQYFALKADHCRGAKYQINGSAFTLDIRNHKLAGMVSGGTGFQIVDAALWNNADALRQSVGKATETPVVMATVKATSDKPAYLAVQRLTTAAAATQPAGKVPPLRAAFTADELPAAFDRAVAENAKVARQVVVKTPDEFVNSAVSALCLAADGLWDDATGSVMHGGVAWRVPLLGWRGPYSTDAAGWHDRTKSHLNRYFAQQNTSPIPATQPGPDEADNLARSRTAVHSNGNFTSNHYDMNLVAVDNFFRHLLWTGDLEYARKWWPAIQRHFEWEKRLFRRPFGPEGLPLYEAYACIWASDDLQYGGAGVTHSSAYNYYHNTMAARVAKLLGEDPTPYETEAALIKRAMNEFLWLPKQGWFAEYKDSFGNELVHPAAALWTHYHTIDSGVPDPKQAWQMCRYVDTQIPHIPVAGPGVPKGLSTLSSTTWMPYTWSINNIAMAEVMHTALADWQAGRSDAAFSIWKGAIVDSMFLGQCPGNVQMTSFFDVYRQEAQRDSGDPVGITWRSVIEGLFGVTPDALNGELNIRPGFPAEWDNASIRHPDFSIDYQRTEGINKESFVIESKFEKPMALRLRVEAKRPHIKRAFINGQPATFKNIDDAVGRPQVLFTAEPAAKWEVFIVWADETWNGPMPVTEAHPGGGAGIGGIGENFEVDDPQQAFNVKHEPNLQVDFRSDSGPVTLFVKKTAGAWTWWDALGWNIVPDPRRQRTPTTVPVSANETVDLTPSFNDRVTQIFKNRYVSPRSAGASMSIPVQGFGGWATNKTTPVIDDAALRAKGVVTLPNGLSFVTPTTPASNNVLFVSQWDNYPRQAVVPLSGRAAGVSLLMAGSTNAMQSRIDNGEVVVTYTDDSTARLALRNPETWWPIEQDYLVDDYGFAIDAAIPMRVDLKTGDVRQPDRASLGQSKRNIPGGSATVLNLPLDPKKELKSLTVRAIANEVVIGLMGVTLQRP